MMTSRVQSPGSFFLVSGNRSAAGLAAQEPCCANAKRENMKTPFLIGERIYFRPLEREDAPQVQEFINDPEVTTGLLIHRPVSRTEEEAFIASRDKDEKNIVVAVVLKDGDRLIGTLGLRLGENKDRKANFGINIGAKDLWNQGYGTEATKLIVRYGFETLNLNRIELTVYEYNARAIRAYEKVGFSREGVMRQATYKLGRYWDIINMGILRAEWDALNDRKASQ
jgi:RimJ/RimL family protein N-acetyltransferase